MSVIQALRTYIATCTDLVSGSVLNVDSLGSTPIQYSIVPQPGARVLLEDLAGNKTREYPFALQSMQSTADDLARIESSEFYEDFADWLDTQTASEVFPELGSGKTVTKIEAVSWAFLYEQGVSDTGVYHINCKLTYDQEP